MPEVITINGERKDALSIPLYNLNKVERVVEKKNQDYSLITLSSQDGRVLKLKFVREDDTYIIFQLLQKFAFLDQKEKLFAFSHFNEFEARWQGWKAYSFEKEVKRLKIDKWEGVKVLDNSNGIICATYP